MMVARQWQQNEAPQFNTGMVQWKVHIPDSKVHGANMGPIWGQQDPGGPHEPCYLGYLTI